MREEFKKILMYYFYERQPENFELPEYTPPCTEDVNEALKHYYNCRKITCELCHVARMFHCKITKSKFLKYKLLREHLCYSKNRLQNLNKVVDIKSPEYMLARQTLENSRLMYSMFLKNSYKKWFNLLNNVKTTGVYHCTICERDDTDHIVFNCGHGTCSECLENIELINNQCPICRELIYVNIPVHV